MWFSVCQRFGSHIVVPFEVDAEYLPLLRKQLELRLHEIETAGEVARSHVQAQLDEVEIAEQAVREHRAAEQE